MKTGYKFYFQQSLSAFENVLFYSQSVTHFHHQGEYFPDEFSVNKRFMSGFLLGKSACSPPF